jgi:hypothetical protein
MSRRWNQGVAVVGGVKMRWPDGAVKVQRLGFGWSAALYTVGLGFGTYVRTSVNRPM